MKPIKAHQNWLVQLLIGLLLTSCTPVFEFSTSDGEPLSSSYIEGRWVFINYWAIWCTPCVKEVQELNAFANHNPAVRVIGVNFDNEKQAVLRRQISRLDIRFPVVTSNIGPYFGAPERVRVLPTTLLVNPDGVLIRTLIGPQTETSLSNAIKQAMAAP